MISMFRKLLSLSAALPVVALANGPDLIDNFGIDNNGAVLYNNGQLAFTLADPNDVSSAQIRSRGYREWPSGVEKTDVIVSNRNPAACGGVYNHTATFDGWGPTVAASSSDGRYVTVKDIYPGGEDKFMISVDCGATYIEYNAPSLGSYTVYGFPVSSNVTERYTSGPGNVRFDQASNSLFLAYNLKDPSSTNIATNTKLVVARIYMPLKNTVVYDLGNVKCSTNGGSGGNAGGPVKLSINDNRQMFIYTACGQEFTNIGGSPFFNVPEGIIFDLNTATVQTRMSMGGYTSNIQNTQNGLVMAIATNGVDFFTLVDNGNHLHPRIKRWTEQNFGAGDYFVSNATGPSPFIDLTTSAVNPFSDMVSLDSLDSIAAQQGATIYGFDGIRLGSGFDGVDVVWRTGDNFSPEAYQGARKSRITGLSSTPTAVTTLLEDYSDANIMSISPGYMTSYNPPGNYFTFLGGGGLFAYQANVSSFLGNPVFPEFYAGFDAYDIS